MPAAGDWRIVLETPMGTQTPILTLIEDGGKLSGKIKGPLGGAEFDNGTVDGNNLNWDISFRVLAKKFKLECTAIVDGDSISGKMEATTGVYNFTGKRMNADSQESNVVSGYQKAIHILEAELKSLKLHTSALAKAKHYADKKGLKINAGCGPNTKKGWLNIDMHTKAELQLDLREPLPFDDGAAAIVYSEHFFEHLDFPDDACNFLSESYRVLQEGGEFSVGVPDTEWPLKSYAEGNEDYFLHVKEFSLPEWCNTRLHYINFHFRQCGDHKYAYDFETLASVLTEAGFVDISKRAFDPELDDPSRERGTLYVKAFKPGRKSKKIDVFRSLIGRPGKGKRRAPHKGSETQTADPSRVE